MENLPEVSNEELLDDNLKRIQSHFRIDDVMFNKGVRYVSKVLDGESRTNSIMFAFDISKDRARSKASDFHRRKWVQEVLRYLSPDEGTLYIGEVDTVIKTAMEMIRDPRRDDRVKIEAIKAVQPFIKQMVQREETNIKITAEANPAEAVMTQMVDAVKQLTANGKMINQKGEIIDVETVQ